MSMTTLIRTSPLHDRLTALEPEWSAVNDMRIVLRIPGDEAAKLTAVAIADLSCLNRTGLKGPLAAQWLQSQGIAVPAQPNTWTPLPEGGVIARLARTEFFIEDGAAGDMVSRVNAALKTGVAGVYPVIRQDAEIVLAGNRVNELLVQTCNVNFTGFGAEERVAVMTSMVGVGVLAIRQDYRRLPGYRIWCDATYAPYLWETLLGIAGEIGGGAIGAGGLLG